MLIMLAEISGIKLMLLNWALAAGVGFILSSALFWAVLQKIRTLINLLDEANADGKISQAEYDRIIVAVVDIVGSIKELFKAIFTKITVLKLKGK